MSAFPDFYDPNRIGTLFYPDLSRIVAEAGQVDLAPSSKDDPKVQLLIVDMQVDFCHQEGNLSVPGALGDIQRLIEFIYRQAEHLSGISCSLDSHLPFQIFHPSWWVNKRGDSPDPLTIITRVELEEGKWQARQQPDWSRKYVTELDENAKKALTVWPYHALLGSVGQLPDIELWSAIFWHALARSSQPDWWTKGGVPGTEHYSILQPEIPVPEDPQGGKNLALLEKLRKQDYLIVAGEAASHCVVETLQDLVDEFANDPDRLSRIFVLRDCMSPVQHPEIDFAALVEKQFARLQESGIRFILSSDSLPF